MGDIRENEMNEASSVDYLRGVRGSDSILLSIETLLKQGNIIRYQAFVAGDDLNNFINNGIYGHSNTTTLSSVVNKPSGTVGEAILVSLACSPNYVVQVYCNITANSVFIRFMNYNRWSPWKGIAFTA